MSERGISFSTPMVEAILAGRKTQTRRTGARPQAAKGDLLYVREACFVAPVGSWSGPHAVNPSNSREACYFKAGSSEPAPPGVRWRRSLYMPRWAARTFLEVTAVREERLQEITAEDALAEGVALLPGENAIEAFKALWNGIYGKKGLGWESNPLVWRIAFRVTGPRLQFVAEACAFYLKNHPEGARSVAAHQSAYEDKLARFKSEEKPEAVLVVADDAARTRIVVAWPTIAVQRKDQSTEPSSGGEHEWWEWLWKNARYSQAEIAERTGIRGESLERMMQILIGNRVLYPDGTVNSFVQRYLREKVLNLFTSKPKRSTKAT